MEEKKTATALGIDENIEGLLLMYKAYNKEKYKLPVVGDFAESQVK